MSTAEQTYTVDATAVEVLPPAPETTGAALAIRPPAGTQVLMPMDVDQVVAGMTAYQSLLPRLLAESDYQEAERGKRFVKKSGWRKIARAFNLSLERISETVERDDHGVVVRASAVYRAVAPNGQYGDGDGYCSADEPRFDRAAGRQKLENDLRATATTRAKNRAISDLVGMGEVSAEEVAPGRDDDMPAFGPAVANHQKAGAIEALCFLIAGDAEPTLPASRDLIDAAGSVARAIALKAGAYMPQIVVDALVLAAAGRTARRGSDEPPDADIVSSTDEDEAAAQRAAEAFTKPEAEAEPAPPADPEPVFADSAQIARLRQAYQGLTSSQVCPIFDALDIPYSAAGGFWREVPAHLVDRLEQSLRDMPRNSRKPLTPTTPPGAIKVLKKLAEGKRENEIKGAFALRGIDYPRDGEPFAHLTEEQVDELMEALS